MRERLIEVLKELIEITKVPRYNNAGTVCQVVMQLVQNEHTLIEIEKTFRELDSKIHLIGLPLNIYESDKMELCIVKGAEFLINNDKYISMLPNSNEHHPFALWACMNGKDEVPETIKNFGLIDGQVDFSLEKTGFLCIKQPNN